MKTIGVVVVALTTQKQTGKDKPMKTPYQEAVELIDRPIEGSVCSRSCDK